MRAAAESSPEWVIKAVTYFDHQIHRFVVGDIEVDGERISAIKPPGASTRFSSLDGRRCVCTPGLVSAQSGARPADAQFDQMLTAGVTTASRICATARECIAATSRTRVRLITYLLLNAFSHARTGQHRADPKVYRAELHAFEQIAAFVTRNGGRVLPAIHCPSVLSAHELVYAELLAAALHLDLGFVLSDCTQAARAFRERFYCSETHLLALLQLLRPGIAVWGTSQLTRHDLAMLRAAGAHAFGVRERGTSARRRQPCAATSVGAARNGQPRENNREGPADPPQSADLDADALVDAATTQAAAALGDLTCGRIAPGLRADLCLFAMKDEALSGRGSEAFLQLFENRRPDAVLVGGKAAYGAIEIAAGEQTPVRPRDTLAQQSKLGLATSS